jgi:hypothetical protein
MDSFVRSNIWWALAVISGPAVLILPPHLAVYVPLKTSVLT